MIKRRADGHQNWTEVDIPELSGRTAVVTGAHVVLACRNLDRAGHAAKRIAAESPAAGPSVVRLDLASQSCVRGAAEEIRACFPRLDLLVNNAGVMEVSCQRTEDGFELTLATNHLGPFALTGLLLDRLAAGARVTALACHPGVVYTDLFANHSRLQRFLLSPAMRVINFWAVQDVRMGTLPALRAATDPTARGGAYFGPRRYGLRRGFYTGYPAVVESSPRSHNEADQARLWQVSERLTGVAYPASS
jgi:short subunit dehydrogenase